MNLTTAQRRTFTWMGFGPAAALVRWRPAPMLMRFVIGAALADALHPAVERLFARRLAGAGCADLDRALDRG